MISHSARRRDWTLAARVRARAAPSSTAPPRVSHRPVRQRRAVAAAAAHDDTLRRAAPPRRSRDRCRAGARTGARWCRGGRASAPPQEIGGVVRSSSGRCTPLSAISTDGGERAACRDAMQLSDQPRAGVTLRRGGPGRSATARGRWPARRPAFSSGCTTDMCAHARPSTPCRCFTSTPDSRILRRTGSAPGGTFGTKM